MKPARAAGAECGGAAFSALGRAVWDETEFVIM